MVTRFLPITSEEPLIEQIFVRLVAIVFSCDLFVVIIAFYKTKYDAKMATIQKKNIIIGSKKSINLNINLEELTNI